MLSETAKMIKINEKSKLAYEFMRDSCKKSRKMGKA